MEGFGGDVAGAAGRTDGDAFVELGDGVGFGAAVQKFAAVDAHLVSDFGDERGGNAEVRASG